MTGTDKQLSEVKSESDFNHNHTIQTLAPIRPVDSIPLVNAPTPELFKRTSSF